MFKKNNRVILKQFLGTNEPNGELSERENYWLLIGKTGVIADIKVNKALIIFDCKIRSFGLICHNEIDNALWISFEDIALA